MRKTNFSFIISIDNSYFFFFVLYASNYSAEV
jgi:hypothetical protein